MSTVLLVACLAVFLQANSRQSTLADPLPGTPARAAELADRIDPNIAPVEYLSALPGIGPAKGQAIVDYRTPFTDRGEQAFKTEHDLSNVRGIGAVTVEKLTDYLVFHAQPTDPATGG